MHRGGRSIVDLAAKNYIRGRNFEYRVINYLRKLGYYCMRAYASKGLYDIIAIPPIRNPHIFNYPLLIQAKKNGYINPTELKNLKDNYKWQGWVMIAYSENHKLKFRALNGEVLIIQ